MDHKTRILFIKKIFFLLVLLIANQLYASDYPFENIQWITTLSENYLFSNGIYLESTCDINENWTELRGFYKIYEENTYVVAEITFENYISKYYLFFADDKHLIIFDNHRKKQIECTNSKYHIDEPWIWPISQCTASSFLIEQLNSGTVEYKPENLTDRDVTKNWVEGTHGNGIGETLLIKNDLIPTKQFYIINGFFYPEKTSLYYLNGRVKKLSIQCLDSNYNIKNEFELNLEDSGNLQKIQVNGKYSFLRFTILDVYPGQRYQDTAISSVFIDGLSTIEK